MDEYMEATAGNVIKLENEGDFIEGIYKGFEESKQFKESYALTVIGDDNKPQVAFVSGIVIDLLQRNDIKPNDRVKVVFKGMKKAEKSGREYKTYQVLYKR